MQNTLREKQIAEDMEHVLKLTIMLTGYQINLFDFFLKIPNILRLSFLFADNVHLQLTTDLVCLFVYR